MLCIVEILKLEEGFVSWNGRWHGAFAVDVSKKVWFFGFSAGFFCSAPNFDYTVCLRDGNDTYALYGFVEYTFSKDGEYNAFH